VISLLAGPGRHLSEEAKILLGQTLNVADQSGTSNAVASRGVADFLHAMIPSNIFYDLGRGSNLSILFFSLILGVAIGTIGGKKARSVIDVAEGLFEAFSKIVDWSMYLLPVGLFSLLANQLASTGTDILAAMLRFVLIVWGIILLVIVVNTAIMCLTLRRSPLIILSALKQSMLIAFGTSNSIAAMPSTIEALTGEKIKLPANIINLVVPIGVVLNSFSMTIMYIAATVFAAELYGVPLHAPQVLMVILLSVLAAVAGAGAPSIVCISMISIVLQPLGLPAQAIIVLLIAVDPLIDPIGTVSNIHTNATISVLVAGGDKNENKG
jgi:proton glutamate symport protein